MARRAQGAGGQNETQGAPRVGWPLRSPFRVSVCAAHSLNATGQSRVTLSLRQEHLRAVRGPCQEERSLTSAQKRPSHLAHARNTCALREEQDASARSQ